VKIAEINSRARARLKEQRGFPLRDRLISRPTVLGRLGTPVAPLANYTLTSKPLRIVAERTLGIDRRAPVPRFAGRSFRRWARSHQSPPAPRNVAFFHNCGTAYYEPDVGEKAVAVLEHNGVHVEIPKQGCCGLPLQSNGLFDDARRYVRRLARALAPYARAGQDIVGPATSCTLMLKREALEILGMEDDPDLRVVSERTYDISEYLLAMHDRGELRTDFGPVPLTLAYHAPCQQQGQNIGKPALDLFALIPELNIVEMDHGCCGIAGTYGLKREKYEIAMKVGEGLFRQIGAAHADVVGCDSETCRWQITHATGVDAAHPVEILHRAYGLG
jgi:glycerol-3-phosphate dehydrogenase subunit C